MSYARFSVQPDRGMSLGAFGLMLRRLAVFAACVDLVYLLVFVGLGLPVMALVNLVGAGMYGAAYVLLGRRRNLPAVALMCIEVLVHASACTVLLGWHSGAHYFLLVFLPAVAVSRSAKQALTVMAFVLDTAVWWATRVFVFGVWNYPLLREWTFRDVESRVAPDRARSRRRRRA
jgi:hypothetical protein